MVDHIFFLSFFFLFFCFLAPTRNAYLIETFVCGAELNDKEERTGRIQQEENRAIIPRYADSDLEIFYRNIGYRVVRELFQKRKEKSIGQENSCACILCRARIIKL